MILRQIYRREEVEEALRTSEEGYRTLIENMGEGIGFVNTDEIFVFVNPSAEKIFGVGKGELTGKNVNYFLQGKNIDILNDQTQNRNQGKESTYELQIFLQDGSKKDILVTATPKFDNGKFIGTFGIFRDITERRKAEAKINMLAHATRSIGECISITDMEDKIIFVNSVFLETYQYTEKELIGYNIRKVRSGNNSPDLMKEILPATFSGGWHGELLNVRKDGSEFPVYLSSTVIYDENGVPIALIGVATDITKRKQDEAALKILNEQLSRAIAEKDKFFSIIAHDLRSPFNSFLGLTQIMAEELSTMTQEQVQKSATGMKRSATNLYHLLENLLEWSRMQRGINTFDPVTFSLLPKISQYIEVLQVTAFKKGIDISIDIQDNLSVYADENLFGSIIRNLTTNAIKFTGNGGKIIIAARSVDERSVEISVKDTGIGMNKRMVDNLFCLDVKTSRKGTADEPSSGLGLLICKDSIESNGGRLWVESEEGMGTTFYFILPATSRE